MRSSILRSISGCWIYLGYFFRFTVTVGLCFSSYYFWKLIEGELWNVCSSYILEPLHWVWNLSKFDNRDTITMSVVSFWCFSWLWASLCTISWYFYRWLWIFFVYCECHICYLMAYLCGTPNRCYVYGSCSKTLVCNCAND